MSENSAPKKLVTYVVPSPEDLEKAAQTICRQLATTDARFSEPEIAHGLSNFLNVIAHIQAAKLNQAHDQQPPEPIDTES